MLLGSTYGTDFLNAFLNPVLPRQMKYQIASLYPMVRLLVSIVSVSFIVLLVVWTQGEDRYSLPNDVVPVAATLVSARVMVYCSPFIMMY